MPASKRSIADLLRVARTSVNLTQRELARRAGTAQSVVARVEAGDTSPTWDTLVHLLGAAGYEIEPTLRPRTVRASHMLADVPRILRLTPEARLIELRNAARFLSSARRSG